MEATRRFELLFPGLQSGTYPLGQVALAARQGLEP